MSDYLGRKKATREALLEATDPTAGDILESGETEQRKESARSLGADAWDVMRRRPLFWVAALLALFFIIVAAAPQLFTSVDPRSCDLAYSRLKPSLKAIFGYDMQGCNIFARTVYGARASILVGMGTALFAALLGGVLGTIAGYLGGWVDAVLSRLADIFFAIPLLLGAIVVMAVLPITLDTPYLVVIFRIVLVLGIFGWPNIFRLMRASVIQVKPAEFVQAARALGANPLRLISSHIVPNALTPLIVVSTIDLGTYIATEATLSFLGVGLPRTIVSWGADISAASALGLIRNAPHMLLFPAAALCLTVLAFIMLGEVVRDALDPKLR
ncbi:MAG: ABC transporter permease [Propionibacteriaceae bacterium]|nr:ABC transporter permease [Propionibacteriaceae bacterium]